VPADVKLDADPAPQPAPWPAAGSAAGPAALRLPLLSAVEARAADAAAVEAGETFDALMLRAAGHLARTVLELAGRGAGLRVDLVVGHGDNGGDGWAAAPILAARGVRVRVLAPDGADVATSEASGRARARWIASGGDVVTGPVSVALLRRDGRAHADVVVDCLLGTGASGPLRGNVAEAAAAIRAARDAGALVVACDMPTGVGADDGSVAEGAVIADATVTFGGPKRGLLLAPGSVRAGRIRVGRLGPRFTPRAASPSASGGRAATAGGWWTLTAAGARPERSELLAEKRQRGTVLIVAGRVGTAGAAVLAGRGALAAGAGLVTIAVPGPIRAEVAAAHPAVMTVGLPADADGALHADAVHALALEGIDAVVAGPGLGTGAGAAAVVGWLRRTCPRLVLDADALNVHRDGPELLGEHPSGPGSALVLTPHLRELDRLGGEGTYAARADRVPALAARWGAHVVVKGPGTLSVAPDGTVFVGPAAVPALATAGTGDVLAGMLGAVLAGWGAGQEAGHGASGPGLDLLIARAVWWHAAAGALAGTLSGGRTDAVQVLRAIPQVLADLAGASDVADPGPSGRVLLEHVLLESVVAAQQDPDREG
jgi:hydroxyethylthiazole kinase-like uncharacterized protein yjeF